MTGEFLRTAPGSAACGSLANADFFADVDLVRRNVDLASVRPRCARDAPADGPGGATVARPRRYTTLSRRRSSCCKSNFAGHALGARGLLKVVAELAFLGEVDSLGLLLLAQLQAVAYDLWPCGPCRAGREQSCAFRSGHLSVKHFVPFEEQLHSFTAAETANCICITCQVYSPY